MDEAVEAEEIKRIAGGRIGWAMVRILRAAVCFQEVAREEALRGMQMQHAKQVAKLRQEMQATVQQMAEEQRGAMHDHDQAGPQHATQHRHCFRT